MGTFARIYQLQTVVGSGKGCIRSNKKWINWYSNGKYTLTSTDKYSVSASYFGAPGNRHVMDGANLMRNSILMPKHRFWIWLAVQGKLLTKERLCKMGIASDNTTGCLCEEDADETTQHLFGECPCSKLVWGEISSWSGLKISHNDILRNIL